MSDYSCYTPCEAEGERAARDAPSPFEYPGEFADFDPNDDYEDPHA